MLLAQPPSRHKRAGHQPQARNARVQNPHDAQTPREGVPDGGSLGRVEVRNSRYHEHVGRGVRAGEALRQTGREACGPEGRLAQRHAVLEHDAAQHDGRGGGQVTDEAEGRGRGGRVGLRDVALHGNQGRREE